MGDDDEIDDFIALGQISAGDAGGGAAHVADVGFVEADGHAFLGGEEDLVVAVGDGDADEAVLGFEADGDDAAFHDVAEGFEEGFLDDAQSGGEEEVLAFVFEIADGDDLREGFFGLHLQQVGEGAAFGLAREVGNVVDLLPIDAAEVGEEHEVVFGAGDEEVFDEVAFLGVGADDAAAAAALLAVGVEGHALDVAFV